MAQQFISGNHWLEPVWPSPGFPASISRTAETLSFRAGKLTGLLHENTAARIGGLMRITNSYYSNLIEGQFTEPATLSARVPKRDSKTLREEAGVKQEMAKALHILLTQGEVARADFKTFSGLHDRVASDQLRKLIDMGVVEAPSAKSRSVFPGLPVWFAQMVFPDLHRRFH